MPSAKKIRVKAKKAKASATRAKEEQNKEDDVALAQTMSSLNLNGGSAGLREIAICHHGYPTTPVDSICLSVLEKFEHHQCCTRDKKEWNQPGGWLKMLDEGFNVAITDGNTDVLFSISAREKVQAFLLHTGANIVLDHIGGRVSNPDEDVYVMAFKITYILLILERLPEYCTVDSYEDDLLLAKAYEKREGGCAIIAHERIMGGGARELIRFYFKRLPCDCLCEMYKRSKDTTKTDICDGCKKKKEVSNLQVCSKCRNAQYCSRECQLKHWPRHKESCGLIVNRYGCK